MDRWIAYEPHPDFPAPSWADPSLPYFEQRGGDLGELDDEVAVADGRDPDLAHLPKTLLVGAHLADPGGVANAGAAHAAA